MKMKQVLSVVPFLFAACGDGLVDNDYLGEPLASVQGNLEIRPGARSNDTLEVNLIWHVESAVDYKFNQSTSVEDANLGRYRLDLLVPPPDSALNTDPETQGHIGFASIMVYDDPRSEGPIDLSRIEPKDYASLMYRWRGGSSNVMLAYAKDAFPAGSRIATELGGPVEPGFFLVRFDGDCRCPISREPCKNTQGETCARNQMVVLAAGTEVPLSIVQDLTDFWTVHAPDWLFL